MGMYALLEEEMSRRIAALIAEGLSGQEAEERVREEFEVDDPS